MNVIYAPQQVVTPEKPTLFIAGSIEMGVASRWQNKVIRCLSGYQGTLLNPRRKTWDASWHQAIENPEFREQVDWELDAIERSDLVAFYLEP